MISTTDFKRGARLLLDGQPYQIEDYQVQTPSARGAATLVRCRLRNIVDGTIADRTFKAGERFEEPDVQFRQVQFLYGDGESSHFMDLGSYEQFALVNERIEETVPWLADGLNLNAVYWNGSVAGISLPQYVEAEVEMAGAGSRSDTASGKNLKDATLTNGLTIRVPLFVESGERVIVDPRTLEFIRRAAR
jgi:elongation factor P